MATYRPKILSVDVDLSASGDVVAAPGAGRKIRVVGWVLQMDAVGTFKFQSGASTDKSGPFPCAQYGGSAIYCLPGEIDSPDGQSDMFIFECGVNEKLNLVLTGGGAAGVVTYYIK